MPVKFSPWSSLRAADQVADPNMANYFSGLPPVKAPDQVANPDMASFYQGLPPVKSPDQVADPDMASRYAMGRPDLAPFPMLTPRPEVAPGAPANGSTGVMGGYAGLGVPKAKVAPISEEMRLAMEAVKQGGANMLASKEQMLSGANERLAALQGKDLSYDISPLAALADQWSGSNLAQSYRPPETLAERRAQLEKLQAAVAEGHAGLSEQYLQNAQTRLAQATGLDTRDYTRGQDSIKNQMDAERINLEREKINMERQAKADALKDKLLHPMSEKDALEARTSFVKLPTTGIAQGNVGMLKALDEYEKAFHESKIDPTGAGAKKLTSAYTNFVIKFKNAAGLGALSGPDMGLVTGVLPNAAAIESYIKSRFTGDEEGIQAAIDQARLSSHNDFKYAYGQLTDVAGGNSAVKGMLDGLKRDYTTVGGDLNYKSGIKLDPKTGMTTVAQKPLSRAEMIAAIEAGKGK